MDVADRSAILDLTARYNRAFDEGHDEKWVHTFTPDGEFHFPARGVSLHGHAELRTFFAARRPGVSTLHLTTDHLVWEDSDIVRHWSQLMVFRVFEGAATLRLVGNYEDIVTRKAEGWRFAYRNATLIEVQAEEPTVLAAR